MEEKCAYKDRKKAIIRYPPSMLGEGNVPIERFQSRISLVYDEIDKSPLSVFLM